MRIVEIERNTHGPRLRVLGQRVHHAPVALVIAALCVVHDWADRRDWFRLGAQR